MPRALCIHVRDLAQETSAAGVVCVFVCVFVCVCVYRTHTHTQEISAAGVISNRYIKMFEVQDEDDEGRPSPMTCVAIRCVCVCVCVCMHVCMCVCVCVRPP